MDMKKIKRFALLLIMASLAVNVQAQLEQAVKKIFAGDTVATHPVSLHRDSDSARVANLQKSLEEARLNEANMRMEMEQMRLQMLSADSVKFSQQRQRIDSLRQFTKGIPVVAEGDTLFYLLQNAADTLPATGTDDRCRYRRDRESVLISVPIPFPSTIRILCPT